MYASATQLIQRYGVKEVTQRADDSTPPKVKGDMLKQAAAGEDMSGYTPAEQEATAAAMANVERALRDAGHTINGYIGGRYQLPLAEVPEVLTLHCCQIARFVLYDDIASKQVDTLYQASIKFLRDVSTGMAELGLTTSGATAPTSAGAEMISDGRTFGRDSSKGFI